MATSPTWIGYASAEGPAAAAIRVGEAFVRTVVTLDFDGVEALFAPEVRFLALTPGALREAATASGARAWLERWFGDTSHGQLVESRVEIVVDRLHAAYRVRLLEDGTWYLVEQQLFGSLEDGQFTDVALVCSGFRRIEPPSGEVPIDRPPVDKVATDEPLTASLGRTADARLDAIGKSCATLTPDIRSAVRRLDPGQVLEVVADDPTAEDDLRAWARLTGNDLIDVTTDPDGARQFYIRRGAGSSTAAQGGTATQNGAGR